MSLRLRALLIPTALAFCTLAARPARGQITNLSDVTSTPIPGAGHNYLGVLNETVNPANGSVSLRISVPMPKGRGLTVPFSFAYESNGTPAAAPTSSGVAWLGWGGWTYTHPSLSVQTQTGTTGDGTGTKCTVSLNYMYTDPSGGRHPLKLSIYGYAPAGNKGGVCTDAILPNGNFIDPTQYTSGGDAFFQATTTAIPTGDQFAIRPVSISDPDGTGL